MKRVNKKLMTTIKKKKKEPKLRVKISPRLQWVAPYIRRAKAKMPSLILPTQVRSFKPTKSKIMRVLGNVYFETRIIVLATHTQQTYLNRRGKLRVKKIINLSRPEILDTLAHELAHIRYPDHNYEHDEYTKTIFRTFEIMQKCPTCKGVGKIPMEIRS